MKDGASRVSPPDLKQITVGGGVSGQPENPLDTPLYVTIIPSKSTIIFYTVRRQEKSLTSIRDRPRPYTQANITLVSIQYNADNSVALK